MLIKLLGWASGSPISVVAQVGRGVIVVNGGGAEAVDARGHIRLLADVRHACRIHAGDRFLLVAIPDAGRLVVYTPRAVESILFGRSDANADPND